MKLKQKFVLRTIAGESILIPVGNAGDSFHGIVTLNETGRLIWEKLEAGCEVDEIANAICAEYDATKEEALSGVHKILGQLKELGVLE